MGRNKPDAVHWYSKCSLIGLKNIYRLGCSFDMKVCICAIFGGSLLIGLHIENACWQQHLTSILRLPHSNDFDLIASLCPSLLMLLGIIGLREMSIILSHERAQVLPMNSLKVQHCLGPKKVFNKTLGAQISKFQRGILLLQGEPRAALSMASQNASPLLKLSESDLLLYSARVIPGNDTKVMQMMNRISELGPEIALGRHENLHTSGHAYQ